jgi:hypothetical protein
MWYNTILSFVPMDPNMYSMYDLGIKELDLLIFGRKNGYVVDVTQPELVPPIEQLMENHYPIRIPTFRLEQLVFVARGVLVQQTMIIVFPINILVTRLYYLSMVMMFQSSSLEWLIHIQSRVENCLEVCLMEDC